MPGSWSCCLPTAPMITFHATWSSRFQDDVEPLQTKPPTDKTSDCQSVINRPASSAFGDTFCGTSACAARFGIQKFNLIAAHNRTFIHSWAALSMLDTFANADLLLLRAEHRRNGVVRFRRLVQQIFRARKRGSTARGTSHPVQWTKLATSSDGAQKNCTHALMLLLLLLQVSATMATVDCRQWAVLRSRTLGTERPASGLPMEARFSQGPSKLVTQLRHTRTQATEGASSVQSFAGELNLTNSSVGTLPTLEPSK